MVLKMLNLKIIFVVSCLTWVVTAASKSTGGVGELHGTKRHDAVQLLHATLSKLAAGDGPSYKAGNVYSVTSQVVSGIIYRYQVDLTDQNNVTKRCNASIWSQPWLEQGDEITIKCPGSPVVQEKP